MGLPNQDIPPLCVCLNRSTTWVTSGQPTHTEKNIIHIVRLTFYLLVCSVWLFSSFLCLRALLDVWVFCTWYKPTCFSQHVNQESYVERVFPKATSVKSSFWRRTAQLKTSGTLGDSLTNPHGHSAHTHYINRENTNTAEGRGCTLPPHRRRGRRWGAEQKLETKLEELVRRGEEERRWRGGREKGRRKGGLGQTEPVTWGGSVWEPYQHGSTRRLLRGQKYKLKQWAQHTERKRARVQMSNMFVGVRRLCPNYHLLTLV